MNHISLKKVTLIVSTCALASYFVSADEKVAKLDAQTIKVSVNKVITEATSATATKDISALLTQIDSDKNGLLSKAEVMKSKNELLAKHFKDIDKNADTDISKSELKSYFSALKAKS